MPNKSLSSLLVQMTGWLLPIQCWLCRGAHGASACGTTAPVASNSRLTLSATWRPPSCVTVFGNFYTHGNLKTDCSCHPFWPVFLETELPTKWEYTPRRTQSRCSYPFLHSGIVNCGEASITSGYWRRPLSTRLGQMQRYNLGSATPERATVTIGSVGQRDGLTTKGDLLVTPVFRAARSF